MDIILVGLAASLPWIFFLCCRTLLKGHMDIIHHWKFFGLQRAALEQL